MSLTLTTYIHTCIRYKNNVSKIIIIMGLDMDIVRVNKRDVIDDVSFVETSDQTMLIYWRNYRALHDTMTSIFYRKKGYGIFNRDYVRITEDDIKDLIDIVDDEVERSHRIWLGDDDVNSEKRFLDIIKDTLRDGYAVYYTSSW